MTAVNNAMKWGMGACAAVLALALNVGGVSAQQKAPDAAKDAAKTAPAPATKAPAAPAAKAPAKEAKKPAAPANPCTALKDETGCTANAECGWTKETTITKGPQAGTKRAAYCHKKPATKAKAAPAPAAKAPAAPAPAAKAPAAPAPAAKAPAPAAPAPAPKN